MGTEEEGPPSTRGAEFEFDDGTLEVVFETAGQRVLTVREYPTRAAFERAVARATFRGENEAVAEMPDVGAFEDE